MTDTAKPTPGPYKLQISSTQPLALWSDDANGVILEAKWRHGFPPQRDLPCEEALKNLSLAQKAFETYHETGLTPRQLLGRVRELEADIAEIAKWGQPIIDMIRAGESDSIRDPWISGLETALGKHGEDV